MMKDFITGKKIEDIGAEANRQEVEKYLVNERGYSPGDIEVNLPVEFSIAGEVYRSFIDIAVKIEQTRCMVVKCAAGSLGSREREILSAARIVDSYQIPLAIVSDGRTAFLLDVISGKRVGKGMAAIPSKKEMAGRLDSLALIPLPAERLQGERLIFRSYDSMNVNVNRS
jgi:hypothetical protein